MGVNDAPFPNRLRELRLAAFQTRESVAAQTAALAAENPLAYGTVSARTLERLESGGCRPRIRIAAAIAVVFSVNPNDVFPLGPDDGIRNPQGNTRIAPDRPSPGRPRKTP